MTLWQSYNADIKQRGLINPYENEREFNRAYGIKEADYFEPFIARKSTSHKKVAPTFENHEKPKCSAIKKPKAERKPRSKMSDEERRAKKESYRIGYLKSEKGRASRREINARYAKNNRDKINEDAKRRYHEKKKIIQNSGRS